MADRKYFGTDGIRGKTGEFPITPEFVLKLGWAVGKVLGNKPGSKIVVGKDTRISGYMFESAIEAGLAAAGMDSLLVGPMPTPAIAYLTRAFRAQAGVVISASHNPYYDNGVKFFSSEGKKLPDGIELAIEEQLDQPLILVSADQIGKAVRINDAVGRYIEFCKGTIPADMNLNGLKIVVDCANGATYNVAPRVFRELGAEVVELFVEPDGLNINANCGATNVTALRKIVVAENADLGVALDGDGDRVILVDHNGEMVDGDEILFIIAKHRKAQNKLIGGVVGTVMSNLGMELALQELAIPFVRAKVGDRFVMEKLEELGWQYGGESSGHIICLNRTTTGAGVVSALQLLVVMRQTGRELADLRKDMQKFPQVMINVRVTNKAILNNNPALTGAVTQVEKRLGKTGRVLLRPSGTEPVVRVMVEGEDHAVVSAAAEELADIIRAEQ
jgi:phosphoglucosamine mutase